MTFAIRQHRLPVRAQRRSLSLYAADFLAFLIGATITFNLQLIGQLPVAEIIMFSLLPFFVTFRPGRAFSPLLKMVYLFSGLWLFGQVMSDIYHETRTVDWVRGDAAIIFFAIDIACLAVLLVGNDLRKLLFIAGFAAGSFVSTVFSGGATWKFGYAFPTILTVLIISSYFYGRRMFMTSGLLLAGIIAVNLVLNFRSPVLTLLIVIVLVFPVVPERIGDVRILPRPGNAMRIVVLAGFAMGAAWLARTLVSYVTATGLVSEEEKEKNEEQARVGNLLLGGRPEILVSYRAVMESPILGHGSWATDRRYAEMLFDLQVESGMSMDPQLLREDLMGYIPAHSHLMGAWVWAGILGAVFWFYILSLTVKAIIRASVLRQPSAPLYLWILVVFFWDILFSPFGNSQRCSGAIAIILILDLLEHRVPAIHKVTLSYWKGKRYLREPWDISRSTRLSRLGAWRRPVPVKRNWRGVRGL